MKLAIGAAIVFALCHVAPAAEPTGKYPEFRGGRILALLPEHVSYLSGDKIERVPYSELTPEEVKALEGHIGVAHQARLESELRAEASKVAQEKSDAERKVKAEEWARNAPVRAAAAAELQRQRAEIIARIEARERAHREAAITAKELELREREVRAAEDAANELRQFRLQMQLDAMEARGQQGVIVDYGPRRK